MTYNKRDFIVGLVFVIAVLILVFLYFKNRNSNSLNEISNTVPEVKFLEEFEDNFNMNLSKDGAVEMFKLHEGDFRGLVTETEVLLDANKEDGYLYQGWIEKDGKTTLIGSFIEAKGGFILLLNKLPEKPYKIIVSKEKTLDYSIETRILEGSF